MARAATKATAEFYLYANTVDRIGELRAQIKLLQDQLKENEKVLKDAARSSGYGWGEFHGDWYRVTVSCYEQARINWQAVAKKLEPSHQLITAHTSHTEVCKLTVSAHKKGS